MEKIAYFVLLTEAVEELMFPLGKSSIGAVCLIIRSVQF